MFVFFQLRVIMILKVTKTLSSEHYKLEIDP